MSGEDGGMDGDGWVTGDVGGVAGDDELTLSLCVREF
jgi:hypothetical protein